MFIDNRENAEKEARAALRGYKRAGAIPAKAAQWRREAARMAIAVARKWRAKGEMELAVKVAMVARGHLIIARAWDRAAAKEAK